MSIVAKLIDVFDGQAKRVTLSHLRSMSEKQIVEYGFSPELLREGVKAWPWKALPEAIAEHKFSQKSNLAAISTEAELREKFSRKNIPAHRYAA